MKNLTATFMGLLVTLLLMPETGSTQNWLLTGNASTAANHYLGTTDNRNLRLATNGSVRMTITSTGNFGIGTTLPGAKLHLTTGSLLVSGSSSTIPSAIYSVTDNYFYYQPLKGALRFGYKLANTAYWDTTNMGLYSLAFGNNSMAKGMNSLCSGDYAAAFGRNSLSLGHNSQAGGYNSFSMGLNSGSGGDYAFSYGESANAAGFYAFTRGHYSDAPAAFGTAFGQYLSVNSYNSMVIGRYNLIAGTSGSWVSTEPLFVAGNGTGSTVRSNAMTLFKNGNMTLAGTLTQNSDMRLKQNVEPVLNVLEKVRKIQPIYYDFINKELHPAERQLGFSAQEIQQQFPELVRADENQILSVNYSSMSAVVLQALKEQQVIIDQLVKEIKLMKSQMSHEAGFKPLESDPVTHQIFVHPNPAGELITVNYPAAQDTDGLEFTLLSITGQVLIKQTSFGANQVDISLNGIPAGNYILTVGKDSRLLSSTIVTRK